MNNNAKIEKLKARFNSTTSQSNVIPFPKRWKNLSDYYYTVVKPSVQSKEVEAASEPQVFKVANNHWEHRGIYEGDYITCESCSDWSEIKENQLCVVVLFGKQIIRTVKVEEKEVTLFLSEEYESFRVSRDNIRLLGVVTELKRDLKAA